MNYLDYFPYKTIRPEQVTAIEASIESEINSLITPTTVTLTIGEPVPPVEE